MNDKIPTPSNLEDNNYQEVQRIYLDWHNGKRPLSGFMNAILSQYLPKEAVLKALGKDELVKPPKDIFEDDFAERWEKTTRNKLRQEIKRSLNLE